MENKKISFHEVKVFKAIKESTSWMTSRDLARGSGVAERTARAKVHKFVRLGLVDREKTFPAYKYKYSEYVPGGSRAYMCQLEAAEKAFGL